MKKVIVIYIIFIIIIFFIPVLMVKEQENKSNELNECDIKIRLLLSEKNEIVEMSLDEYIMGVLIGEMPVSYELEALKAQAVVARTYTLNKIINEKSSHENADMCDDINHCQAYKTKEYALSCWDDEFELEKWNKIRKAVLDTKNEVITYNNELINAFFHANSGGKTEDSLNLWGKENIPYLKSVEGNEVDIRIEKVTFSHEEFEKIMSEKYPNYIKIFSKDKSNNNIIDEPSSEKVFLQINDNRNDEIETHINEEETRIKILEKNSSGRVDEIKISNITLLGTEARTLFNLRSTFFELEITDESIIFNTKGYGHGVGLSQDGANSMAKNGALHKEIIKHYYTNVNVANILDI